MLILSSQRSQEYTTVEKVRFIAHFNKGEHTAWVMIVCVSGRRCWKKSIIGFGLWLSDLGGSKEAMVFSRLDTIRNQRQFCDWVSDLIASYSPCWWGRDSHLRVMGWMHAQHPTLDTIDRYLLITYTCSHTGLHGGCTWEPSLACLSYSIAGRKVKSATQG